MYRKLSKLAFVAGTITFTTVVSVSEGAKAEQVDDPRPNIVMIVADDMGYSDLGFYGSEISTPTLDDLADKSMVFNNFYTAPACSPTRSMLLTGVDNHRAGLGNMYSQTLNTPSQKGQPGYEGILNDRVVTVATHLKDAGYHTYMAGKWHLGEGEEGKGKLPHDRGFERTFALIPGAASHYSDQIGFSPGRPIVEYSQDGKKLDIEKEPLSKDFYSSKSYTDKMIQFIDSKKRDGKPFFSFLSYTAPHGPLHAPQAYIDKYADKYNIGWDEVRKQRFDKMQERGVIPDYLEMPPRLSQVTAWDALTPKEQRVKAKKMAIYAAMIDYLDMSIGRFLDYLKEIREYDNTIIIFFSDNGADEKDRAALSDYQEWFNDETDKMPFNMTYENMGLPYSWSAMEFGWAQVSATPFYATKSTVAEGGIHAPFFVSYPRIIRPSRTDAFASVLDLTPTILDYAGVEQPGTVYDGRCVFAPDGKSLRPVWEGWKTRVYGKNEPVSFELYGTVNKALIMGDWKILRLGDEPWGNGENTQWQLFNLRIDPRELHEHDLSRQYPQQLGKMISLYEQYEKEVRFISVNLPKGTEPHDQTIPEPSSRMRLSLDSAREIIETSKFQIVYDESPNDAAYFMFGNDEMENGVLYATSTLDELQAHIPTSAKKLNLQNIRHIPQIPIVFKGITFPYNEYMPYFEDGLEVDLHLMFGTRYGYEVLYSFDDSTKMKEFIKAKPRQCSDISPAAS